MSGLLLAETRDGALTTATARALSAATVLTPAVTVLVVGHQVAGAAHQAARLQGVERVWLVDHPALEHLPPEGVAALLDDLLGEEGGGEPAAPGPFTHLVAPAGSFSRGILPRVAALRELPMVSEVVGVEAPDRVVRALHAGNVLARLRILRFPLVATIRSTAFDPMPPGETAAPILPLTREPSMPEARSRFVAFTPSPAGRPPLDEARVVVGGGLGVSSAAGFALVGEVADALGGAVGATRSAVDAGLAPNDWQIGQTGKVVAPELYLGVGISGALQHLAGIKDARIIAAINSDPSAPIHAVADVGLVADLFEALPELLRQLR